MQTARIRLPIVGVEGAQAGLFPDGVEGRRGMPMPNIGLNHLGAKPGGVQAAFHEIHRFDGVVERGDFESRGGEVQHLVT
ncbi:hypothetical protein GALL_434500 [mine drainage metagenome]|uniref:Uncharacterized protein n=1 Tax=mine drainage metagenome TaxID=410659 RepID=A0A1J5QG09_9ZZZZ